MSPEYLVINCRFWDGTSDYYDRLINLAEDYLDKTDEPTAFYAYMQVKLQKSYAASSFFCSP